MIVRHFLVLAGLLGAATAVACSSDEEAACPDDDKSTKDKNESYCAALSTAEDGELAVQNRKCRDCHTDDLGGSKTKTAGIPPTPLGEEVELYPPNLTSDKETGVGNWSDDQLALAIRIGKDRQSQSLCPQMKHDATMSDFEVYSIVKYLRTVPAVSRQVPRSVCPPTKTKEQQNEPR
jgi:hypothetical protein